MGLFIRWVGAVVIAGFVTGMLTALLVWIAPESFTNDPANRAKLKLCKVGIWILFVVVAALIQERLKRRKL
jgi:hypothetical protein